ncbi:DUF3597 family protein [Sphingomonas ginkgonis]|uniref:DUF3597 family protein n=1 Tax=Sphingomonas ginkgonis TaxID=2315330 RepID=A0A3R9YHK3_9SPHN|nr:DUF3597 family protein [Sphingomonas ginkgonis]RST30091.1 DUF3597 family protein [Sphingomonas ginkgonis]
MSIFSNIMNKIFHHGNPQGGGAPQQQQQQRPAVAPPQQQQQQQPIQQAPVDVGAVLEQMAAQKGGGGNYQSSIVDLLKLLDLDSSLDARKELANELNVHVAGDGTAEENIALHRAVMEKLAQNGGKVPESLRN